MEPTTIPNPYHQTPIGNLVNSSSYLNCSLSTSNYQSIPSQTPKSSRRNIQSTRFNRKTDSNDLHSKLQISHSPFLHRSSFDYINRTRKDLEQKEDISSYNISPASTLHSEKNNKHPPIKSLFSNMYSPNYQGYNNSISKQENSFNHSQNINSNILNYSTNTPISKTSVLLNQYDQNSNNINSSLLSNSISQPKMAVTVFGFPTDKASLIINRFQKFGEIIRYEMGAGNWMHILYKSSVSADMALSQSGKIIDGSFMIGVKQIDINEKNPFSSQNEDISGIFSPSASLSPTPPLFSPEFTRKNPLLSEQTDFLPNQRTGFFHNFLNYLLNW